MDSAIFLFVCLSLHHTQKGHFHKVYFLLRHSIITGADFSSQASKGAVELPFKHVTGYFWYVYAALFLTSGTVIIHKFVMILCLTYMKIMILK